MVAWFALAESHFQLRQIPQESTQSYHVLQVLPETLMQKLLHLITKPLSATPYTDLKPEILRITSPTARQRFNALSSELTLGDMKPPKILNQMEALQGPQREERFFKQLFLSKLPTSVQTALATIPDTTHLRRLAEIADDVNEIQHSAQISTLASGCLNDQTSSIRRQLADLQLEGNALRKSSRQPRPK